MPEALHHIGISARNLVSRTLSPKSINLNPREVPIVVDFDARAWDWHPIPHARMELSGWTLNSDPPKPHPITPKP